MKKNLIVSVLFLLIANQSFASGHCAYDYIPPHTQEDLLNVRNWAIGGAFIHFAEKAGYRWNNDLYIADSPSMEIFNFGLVTATSCFELDVMSGFFGAMTHLAVVYKKERDGEDMELSFAEAYYKIAQSYGFDKYLEPDGVDI